MAPLRSRAQEGGRNLTWSLKAGGGVAYHLHGRHSDEGLMLFAPEVTRGLGAHWEYVAEGQLSRLTDPAGYLVGILPLGARYFPWTTRLRPFVSIGVGVTWTNVTNIPELSRRFNFVLNGDLGVRSNDTWQISGRFLHVSNGGTQRPNLGLNMLILLVGWRPK